MNGVIGVNSFSFSPNMSGIKNEAISRDFFDEMSFLLERSAVKGCHGADTGVFLVNQRQFTFLKRGIVETKRKAITRRRKRKMRRAYR